LQALQLDRARVQVLVLTPTRELALQVAEAIHAYGKGLGPLRLLPVYGGQSMEQQVRRLRGGVHLVVGTPGRIMDHLRRGTLSLDTVRTVVLDEADEMLRMGFIEDVEWILSRMPPGRQMALFSATMPPEIRRIAARHLREPESVQVERQTVTVPTVEQRYLNVPERQKLDALTRVLEVEAPDTTLIFVRTRTGAAELRERLQARGYAAEAMHGDMTQQQREAVVRGLRTGQVEIAVATDVAARGLDVERISHVVNYDVPHDAESYVHRIGRTARAGRPGTAILFVTPRETRLLKTTERFTGRHLVPMRMPTAAAVAARRAAAFRKRLLETAAAEDLDPYLALVEELSEEAGVEMAEIAAAAVRLAAGDRPLHAAIEPEAPARAEGGMVRLFLDAGRQAGVRPADIVGAVAGEAGIPGYAIGAIDIYDRFAFVEVPQQYADQVLERMQKVKIRSRPVSARRAAPAGEGRAHRPRGKARARRKRDRGHAA
jgi:ATP-dependent RNA helicase DeaD